MVTRVNRRVLVTVAGVGIVELQARRRDTWAARMAGSRLDHRLGAGEAPESSVLLALRAHWLVRVAARNELAVSLRRMLALADSSSRRPTVCTNVCTNRHLVRATAGELQDLVDRLVAGGPVSARGVANLRVLIADGGGPLYRGSAHDLVARLRDVRVALDELEPAWQPRP